MKRVRGASFVEALVFARSSIETDWATLCGGSQLETLGAAEAERRRVTLREAPGTLAAPAANEVDPVATTAANGPAPVVRLTDAGASHVDGLARPTIDFYSASWCCKSRAHLDQLAARYRERDVDVGAGAREEKNRLAPARACR